MTVSRPAKWITGIVAAFVALCLIWLCTMSVPSFEEVKSRYNLSEATLLDRNGFPLQTLRLDFNGRRLQWTPLSEISPALSHLVIFSEDQRFYKHHGIDFHALAGAVKGIFTGSPRGASTITMQVAGMIDRALKPDSQSRRTLWQKFRQLIFALYLDASWSKNEILETYLNLAGFRGELEGVKAMAAGLYGKRPETLTTQESAIAVALLRSPNATPETVAKRACLLLKQSGTAKRCDGLQDYTSILLSRSLAIPYEHNLAPHLARQLLKESGEIRKSTVNIQIQREAIKILRVYLSELKQRAVEDGAIIVIDNKSGDILAWVASSGSLSQSPHTDGIIAPRQAGSTLKPFLYATAVDHRWITAASIIHDAPLTLPTTNGVYTPQNYDKRFHGWVSARTALASSMNIPAVHLITVTSIDTFYNTLKNLGLDTLTEPAEYYGYSLALGSAEVTLLQLANAYRTLANKGVYSPVNIKLDKPQDKSSHRVFSTGTAFIVGDILSDRNARVLGFGWENPLDTGVWSAVKTGTSRDMRDNWCIGYTQDYTVGVWVGNFSGNPMHNVSGVSGAAPVWRAMIQYLHQNYADKKGTPLPPKDIVSQQINFSPAFEATRQEWFLKGTEQTQVEVSGNVSKKSAKLGIHYPVQGSIFAIDAEIPVENQRIFFIANTRSNKKQLFWQIDNAPKESLEKHQGWFPLPGKHQLKLIDENGNIVDKVNFIVKRGMGFHPNKNQVVRKH